GQTADDQLVAGARGAAASMNDDHEFRVERDVKGEGVFSGRIGANVGQIIQAEVVGIETVQIGHDEHGTAGGIQPDADAGVRAGIGEGESVEVKGADGAVRTWAGFWHRATAGDTAGEEAVGEGRVCEGNGVGENTGAGETVAAAGGADC